MNSTNLKRLNKGPQQDTDGVALPQKLDESSSSKQPQKAKVDQLVLLKKGQSTQTILVYTGISPPGHSVGIFHSIALQQAFPKSKSADFNFISKGEMIPASRHHAL